MKIQYVKIIFCIGITPFLGIYGRVAADVHQLHNEDISVVQPKISQQSKQKQRSLELKKLLYEWRNHPAIRAFLDTIAVAEGTFSARAKGYSMMYPRGKTFKGFEAHPAVVSCAMSYNKKLCSTAAGRYMFLKGIWETIAKRLDLHDFSPLNQDIAAIYLLYEKKAIEPIKKGDIREALERTKKVWASLPGSPHKQPVKKYEILKQVFALRYAHYKKYLNKKYLKGRA